MKPTIIYLYLAKCDRSHTIFDEVQRILSPVGHVKEVDLDSEGDLSLGKFVKASDIVLYEAPRNKPEGLRLEALAGGELDGSSKFCRINPFNIQEVHGLKDMIQRAITQHAAHAIARTQVTANADELVPPSSTPESTTPIPETPGEGSHGLPERSIPVAPGELSGVNPSDPAGQA